MSRKLLSVLAASAIALSIGSRVGASVTQPVAQTRAGALAGLLVDDIAVFRGVPFAKPPVGPLRWRPPQPFPAWSGVRDATAWGHICMQAPPKDVNSIGPTTPSEDCLTLNVFAPASRPAAPLPVMVWIHGGGYTLGSGIGALSDGGYLVRQGVIVVTINYRLGRFGFFAHPALTAESRGGEVADYGLMDQIAALNWVRDNIAAFGGDPRNVTIFGGSAGGNSVLALMASPLARGLFEKAISQSGLGRDRSETLAEADAAGVALAAKWGAGAGSVDALRAVPADRIVEMDAADSNAAAVNGEMPIIDGKILTDQITKIFEEGREARTPLIIGTTDFELPALVTPPELKARVAPYAAATPALREIYKSPDAYEHYLSDAIFAEPANYLGALHARRSPTFRYRFSILPAALRAMGFTGAFHSLEGPYVFGNLGLSGWPATDRDKDLAKRVSAYWIAFAKSGTPDHPGDPKWPGAAHGEIMNFTNDGPRPMVDDRRDILDGLAGAYRRGDLPLVIGVDARPATR